MKGEQIIMKSFFKMLYAGISTGCLIFVIWGMIFFSLGGDYAASITHNFIAQAIGSMIVGVGFCVPALVYDSKKLPMGLKVLIHMGIGFVIYFIVAFSLKWIDFKYGIAAVTTTIIIAVAVSFLIWLCFYLYYKREAKLLNDKIKEKQNS